MGFRIGEVDNDLHFRIVHKFFHRHSLYARVMILHPLSAGLDLVRAGDDFDDLKLIDHVVHVGTFADTAAADYADFHFF